MNVVGLDIGTYSMKAIEAKVSKTSVEVLKVIEAPNYLGISIPVDDIAVEKLSQQIEAFFSDNGLPSSDVRLALPESMVSTKVIEIPSLSDAELASAIGWQAEQHIPIPKDDLSLEYQVLFRPPRDEKNTMMRVLLIGTKQSVVEKYITVFAELGIEPRSLETQTLSLLRAISISNTDPTTLVCNMGFSTTDISLVREGELMSVFSYPQGGILFTRAVENLLQLPTNQAEEYKRSYGLDPQYFEGKVQQAILPVVDSFVDTVRKAMQYYSTQHPQEKVQRVLMAGGASQLPGLIPHLASVLGVEVLLVSPFDGVVGAIPQYGQSSFTVSMGLTKRQEG